MISNIPNPHPSTVGVFNYKDIYCEMRDLIKRILRENTDKMEVKELARYDYTQQIDNTSVARIMFKIVEEYNSTSNSYLKKILKDQAIHVFRVWTHRPPKYISQKILERFINFASNINPFNFTKQAKKQLRGKQKLINISDFVWEHTVPVFNTINRIFASENIEEVINVLNESSDICIVTTEEDTCLNNSGFRIQRPEGWMKAYEKCGIIPITKDAYMETLRRVSPPKDDNLNKIGPNKSQKLLKRLDAKKERIEISSKWAELLRENGLEATQPHSTYPEYLRIGNTTKSIKILFGSKPKRVGVLLGGGLSKLDKNKWIMTNPELVVDEMNSLFPGLNFKETNSEEKTFNFDFDRYNFEQSNIDLLKRVINGFGEVTKIYE
jgi:hypothetical protein